MKRILYTLAVAAVALLARPAAAQGFVVVVNEANPTASLPKAKVAQLFLKQDTKWDSGKTVAPVDLAKGAAAREAFSKAVLGRPLAAVESFWQQQIFAGNDVPPPTRPSDAEVLAFVKGNPNAIGYVAAGTALGAGVKAVAIQ